jgi:AcrR family transcriptional regulator
MKSPALPAALQTKRFEEKREAIVNAAARLFNDRGVKGATFADIAAEVGMATNSITYYYRRKEELACACFLRATEAFDEVAEAAGRETTIAARLRGFLRLHAALLARIDSGAAAPIIFFDELHALPEAQLQLVYAAYTAMFRKVRRLLSGPETEGLSRDELTARTHLLLSVAHWLRRWIWRHEASQYDRLADRVLDLLLCGLAESADAWEPFGIERDWTLVNEAGGTSDAFLRAATRLINEQGYEGASIAKISAVLNLTKGAFYHHHETKDDLVEACFERSFALVRRALELAEARPAEGWQKLSAMARALIRLQLAPEGPLLRAAATSAIPNSGHREEVRRTLQQLAERIASLVVDGMVDGSLRRVDASVAAQTVMAGINATAEAHRWMKIKDVEQVAQLYARPLLVGLLAAPAGSA